LRYGWVVALPTLSQRRCRPPAQGSVPGEWLALSGTGISPAGGARLRLAHLVNIKRTTTFVQYLHQCATPSARLTGAATSNIKILPCVLPRREQHFVVPQVAGVRLSLGLTAPSNPDLSSPVRGVAFAVTAFSSSRWRRQLAAMDDLARFALARLPSVGGAGSRPPPLPTGSGPS